MDDVEIAQRNSAHLERLNLQRQLDSIPKGDSAEECEDCGDEISAKRREAAPACTRCITCQQLHERKLRERR